ncbi:MAG: hypothetical protein IJV88_00125 [Ruminococcus sp.]|nr:hypothetical protein [Ruminococcus sp.]
MKKFIAILMAVVLSFSLVGCEAIKSLLPEKVETERVTVEEIDALQYTQDVFVQSVKYAVQDTENKKDNPDMLQAVITNNSDEVIDEAVVSFVAWDDEMEAVELNEDAETEEGEYVRGVSYKNMELQPQGTYGKDSGIAVEEDEDIVLFKAVVEYYTTEDGETITNPYADDWKTFYAGQDYDDDMKGEIVVEDGDNPSKIADKEPKTNGIVNVDELAEVIAAQSVKATDAYYSISPETDKEEYPDMLQADIENNLTKKIKNMVVAFAAWDANGMPQKIVGKGTTTGNFVTEVTFKDIEFLANTNFGDKSGYAVEPNHSIETVEAIVVSYTTPSGDSWENPNYEDWLYLYSGARYIPTSTRVVAD